MPSIEIRPFRRADRQQLTDLVNGHAAAVVPGPGVSVAAVLSQLERQPGEYIVDPWVSERLTLVADQNERVAAAAHLLRYAGDDRVNPPYRNAGEISWLLFWPEGPRISSPYWTAATEAAEELIAACTRQLADWGVSRQYADGDLPVPGVYGVPEQWPHIRALYERAGFTHDGPTELVFEAVVEDLCRADDPPLSGLTIRRSVGLCGTRLSAVLGEDVIGYIEVEIFDDGERVARHGRWADIGNLCVAEQHRRRGVATWLLGRAAEWLRLAHVDRLLAYTHLEGRDVTGQDHDEDRAFLQASPFTELTRTMRGWTRDPGPDRQAAPRESASAGWLKMCQRTEGRVYARCPAEDQVLRGDLALRQQQWFRIGGICVAAAVTVVFAANANAGPVAGPSHSATQRSASGFGSEVRNAAAASVTSLRKAAAGPAVVQSPEAGLASTLSPAQLAGQRVIYSYSGFTPPSALLKLIRHGEVGGVIFFSSNFENAAQFTAAVAKLVANNSLAQNPAHNFPLLLMVDQEGGEVRRLPGAPVDSEKTIGSQPTAAERAALATQAGTGAGENLLSFGLNVNLAPVLDVFRAPGDFDDQFQRSYSMNPNIVSTLGADFITAQQATGVAATAKHFPGLGAATASQNTDKVPVTITLSKATLQSVDELPYVAAIAAGVKLVLVSWAKYPNLGSSRPAGLSSVIVQGQLRRRLGFAGVTITDAIGAGALSSIGSIQTRSLLAAQAGMQLILSAAQTPTEGEDAQAGLEAGLNNGTLINSTFVATVTQILTLRSGLPDPSIGFGRA